MNMKLHVNLHTLKILLTACFIAAAGCSGSSSNMSTPAIPARPTGVTAIAGAGQITIAWSNVNGASSYNVYRGASGVSKITGTKVASVVTRSYVDSSGLVNGNTYYYVVTAVNSAGESSDSSPVHATVPALAPPTAVSAVAGNNTVVLSWNPVSLATSYNIYGSGVSPVTKGTGTIISGLTSTTYIHSSLTNSTPYYYVVTALNASGESSESPEVSATPASSPSGTVTISGTIEYQDKEYGLSGFTGNTPYKAVRYAEVDLVTAASNSTITTGITTSAGSYLITLPSPTTTEMYVRVKSIATVTGDAPILVKSLSPVSALYAAASSNFAPTGDTTVNINIPVTSSAGGAFNILDVLTSGYEFIDTWAGSTPYSLSAYWQQGNLYGTYYCDSGCSPGPGIYVLSSTSGDTDEYDDDVIWHEFGHFTAAHFSQDDSQGGAHSFPDNDLDLRLSWSEGWGDFYPGAIKRWLKGVDPGRLSSAPTLTLSQYIDTVGSVAGISFDLGNPGASPFYYSSNEVAVAKVLLDLHTAYGMQSIWDVISSGSFAPTPPRPVNLEAFWNEWKLRGTFAGERINLENIYSGRMIYYKELAFEAAGDDLYSSVTRTVSIPFTEQNTLYKANGTPDKDVFRFSAAASQKFTIQTTTIGTLKNGADTYIRILNSVGSPTTFFNDNWNSLGSIYGSCVSNCPPNGDIFTSSPAPLASKVNFTAPSPGTYYVEVSTTSTNLPPSAGQYGTYTLTITSP